MPQGDLHARSNEANDQDVRPKKFYSLGTYTSLFARLSLEMDIKTLPRRTENDLTDTLDLINGNEMLRANYVKISDGNYKVFCIVISKNAARAYING